MVTDVSPSKNQGLLKGLSQSIPTILVLLVMGGGWLAVHELSTVATSEEEHAQEEAEESIPATLTLPEGKLNAAQFQSEPAQVQPIKHFHVVPGRIHYDEAKHIEVKAPMDGILSEVMIMPGDHVESGQLLAVLSSPEIGQARATVVKRLSEVTLAEGVLQREQTIEGNLNQLLTMLNNKSSVTAIESAFKEIDLGSYRLDLVSAYTKQGAAEERLARIRPLSESGSVTGRSIRDLESEQQIAEAEFRTARDQSRFGAHRATLEAEATVAEAKRQLNLAWQGVEALMGQKIDQRTMELNNEAAWSRLEIRAPFAGTIESRAYTKDERVMRGDAIAILANTKLLSVAASIRESDWAAVSVKPGTKISVSVPALDDRVFEADVRYFGREVQTNTNSVPLVAALDNSEGLLRPGMFVRVSVPVGNHRETLSVKPDSVLQHENQKFVFVDQSGGTFQRVDVTTGQASDEWVEITGGLTAGQLVVTHGAFLLKSELLLQGEGD